MTLTVQPFHKQFDRSQFDCGYQSLNHYIRYQVSQDIRKRLTACFVLLDEGHTVKGYYTLASHSIPQREVPDQYAKQIPSSYTNVPVTLLGRLAVDQSVSGNGYGRYLMVDALKKSYEAALQAVGSMAVVVDPVDERSQAFYEKYGFILLPGSGKMFLPIKTIEKLF